MTHFYNKYKDFEMVEVLILDLVKGSDKFITVKGVLTPSAFGLSLDVLCRMSYRAAHLTSEQLKKMVSIIIHLMKDEILR